MAIIDITNKNFEHEVLNSDKPVILDFYGDTCASCKVNSDMIARLAQQREDIKFGRVDVGEELELAAKFDILSVPAILTFKNGKHTHSVFGPRSKNSVLALLEDD